MNFEIREKSGEYTEYPYEYYVYLDDKCIWFNGYSEEQSNTKIFIDFIKSTKEIQEYADLIIKTLAERDGVKGD